MQKLQNLYQDIIIPLDMSTISVKAKHGSDPPVKMSTSMRRKVVTPMYTTEMTRAKTSNSVQEQQLKKKLKDLDKQQNKMISDMLQMKASLLPKITITSAWDDQTKDQAGRNSNGHHDILTGEAAVRTRKLSGSLPQLVIHKEADKTRVVYGKTTSKPSQDTITPTPPQTKCIHRARSMNEIDRDHLLQGSRPRSASYYEARRRSFHGSRSSNSSTESLPSELFKNAGTTSRSLGGSNEDVDKQRTKSTSALLPLRKAKSTSNIYSLAKTRRVTVDTAELTRPDRDTIFRNSSYNPILINPSIALSQPSVTSNGSRRQTNSLLRLNQLSRNDAPIPPERNTPSLHDQFEQLKTCRYLRVRSEESN